MPVVRYPVARQQERVLSEVLDATIGDLTPVEALTRIQEWQSALGD